MIILDTISTILRIKLSGAVTTNQLPVTAYYVDRTTTTFNPASTNTATNSTTYVTFVSAPAASTQRQVKLFTIQNLDTVSATVIVEFYDGTNGRQLVKIILAVNDTLQYSDGEGFRVIDTNGQIKQSVSTTGTLLAANNLTDVANTITARKNLGIQELFITGGNQATTADTAVDIAELVTATLAINTRYKVKGFLNTSCNNTGGIKYAVTIPTGASIIVWVIGRSTGSTAYLQTAIVASATLGTAYNTQNAIGGVFIEGEISIGATAGTAQFQFASGTATQTSTIVQLGTFIQVTKIT